MAIVRINFNDYEDGEEYLNRLRDETERNFKILLGMLSSYWQTTADGPNYAREIKAMAIAMSKVRLSLDDVKSDVSYKKTRTEFIYQVLTSMMFPAEAADPGYADTEFSKFLQDLLLVYFSGSIPDSIQKAVELVTYGMKVVVSEGFKAARIPNSGFDISDEFGFNIDVLLPSPGSIDTFLAEKNVRILMNIIRPAHTLYQIRFVLADEYIGNKTNIEVNKVLDQPYLDLSNYGYEDFRKFIGGVEGIDPKGVKVSIHVHNEDHSADW